MVDGNIDVTVLDGYAVGTAPKQFDRNMVIAQKELNALVGHNPSLVVIVSLF